MPANQGTVAMLFIGASASGPMLAVREARALAGKGLEGDRYASGNGFYSQTPSTPGARELTLIEAGAIAAVSDQTGIELSGIETRRNVVTEGIVLDSLIGRRFTIGDAVCEGVRTCPPCNHLEELIGKQVMRPLARTGGIRARIVESGSIRIGDTIKATGPALGPVARD